MGIPLGSGTWRAARGTGFWGFLLGHGNGNHGFTRRGTRSNTNFYCMIKKADMPHFSRVILFDVNCIVERIRVC